MVTNSLVSAERNTSHSLLWHVAAILTVAAWGVSFVSTKVLLDHGLSPTEIYVLRFVLAYLLMVVFCHDRFRSNTWRDELLFVVCGMCAGSIYFIAENTALEYTLVSNVSLITTLSPLLTILLIGVLYKNERPKSGTVIGSIVAFLGVGCVIFNSSFVIKMKPLGDLLALAAALSFAIYSLVLRRLNAFYTVSMITRKTFFYGVITALPFLALQPSHASLSVLLDTPVWANLLFLTIFASLLGFVAWAECVKRLGAVTTNNYLYFQPICTLIVSALVLHEDVSIVGYVGCGMILLGVWLSDWLGRRQMRG